MPRVACTAALAVLLACSPSEPTRPVDRSNSVCGVVSPIVLAIGEYAVLDAVRDSGCVALPAASSSSQQYLFAAVSASGIVLPNGVAAAARLQSDASAGSAASIATLRADAVAAAPSLDPAARFHQTLRRRDSLLAMRAARRPPAAPQAPRLLAPVAVGDQRSFNVCANLDCTTFAAVQAEAKVVGRRVALFLDAAAPAGGFTAEDLAGLGRLYDDWMYPIDTTAFGRESDVDNNGLVIALITPAVNRIIPDCNASQSRVLGYFSGADLMADEAGSNRGEIFYALAPDPGNQACTVSTSLARTQVPVVFMHEFQHMISYAEHVLRRGGAPESSWLNEGLSHLAEELGARGIPDTAGGVATDRFTQFAFNDVANAYVYLRDPTAAWLVTPGNSVGSAAERGANWLFVRWLVDQFGADDPAYTRALVQTVRRGAENVAAATGTAFEELVPAWHLANALDDTPGGALVPALLSYRSWNWRRTFAEQRANDPGRFPLAYPLVPDTARAASLTRDFTLRGGSGRVVVVEQAAGAPRRALRFSATDGAPLSTLVAPRWAVVRLR